MLTYSQLRSGMFAPGDIWFTRTNLGQLAIRMHRSLVTLGPSIGSSTFQTRERLDEFMLGEIANARLRKSIQPMSVLQPTAGRNYPIEVRGLWYRSQVSGAVYCRYPRGFVELFPCPGAGETIPFTLRDSTEPENPWYDETIDRLGLVNIPQAPRAGIRYAGVTDQPLGYCIL